MKLAFSLTRSLSLSFACVALIAVSVEQAFAVDSVTRKSDLKKIIGTISSMSKTELTIKRLQGEETIAANDVASIEFDGGGAELKLGYAEENGGRFEMALQRYLKAKSDAKSPSTYLMGEYEYVIARATAKQATVDADKRNQAIQKLTSAQKSYPDHIRFYESVFLLSQLQLLEKDFDGARSTLTVLKKAPWTDFKLAASIVEARVLMNEGKVDEAIVLFDAAAKSAGDSPADQSRKNEAILGHARGLLVRAKYEDALKILDSILEKRGPVEDNSVEAEAYVLQGQALRGLGRNKEAALAYLHVDILFPREAAFHAESLYQLSVLWKLVQHPDRSIEASGKLVQLYPNSEWRKKLTDGE